MTDFSKQTLVAAAGVDPWKLRDQFTAGDPEEIYAMARGFNQAAGDQGDAVTLTTKGLETAGDGYLVNNATPIDVAGQVATARQALGNNGDKLGQIAKILSDTASDLAQRTTTANTQVGALETDVNGVIGRWNSFWQTTGHHLPEEDWRSVKNGYVAEAVQKVKDYGGPIKQSVADYESALGTHLKAMADLGYIPPTDLDEGPGDVDIPDPRTAANGTLAAIKETDPNKAKADFAANTAYLNLLNEKQKSGIPLTAAERAWLSSYYEVVTPHFGEIKDWADKQVGVQPGDKPDQHNPVVQLVSRVGDGFLTLSRNVPYDQLPQSARDILESNLGTTAEGGLGGVFFDVTGQRLPVDLKNMDPALARAAGFVGLLNDYSTDGAEPSMQLSDHLKDASLRWKQQMNVMYANYKADLPIAQGYGYDWPDLNQDEWNALFPDEVSSDALGVVARNRDYTQDWLLTNAGERREVMAMNWQSGQGAADVLLSGTMRTGNPTDDAVAARVALAVVQDTATDYNGLADMANGKVKAAIGTIGIGYIDSFAQYETTNPPVAGMVTLPDGTQISGFTLDQYTKSNFLKFVAAGDPTIYEHYREAALERGQEYLSSVMAQGHTDPNDPVYQEAMRDAVRMTSGADAAAAGYLVDMAKEGASDNAVDQKAKELAYAQAMSDYNSVKGVTDGIKNVMSVAGLFTLPTGAGTALEVGSTGFDMLVDSALKEPDAPDLGPNILNLDEYVQNLADGHVADDAAKAQVSQNIVTMTINSAAASGHPIIDPATGAPVVAGPDGQYPEQVVSSLYNKIDNYTVDLGAQTVNQVISTQNDPGGHGGGYDTEFPTDGGTTGGGPAGEPGSAAGNWTNNDDRYRIYYGDETRWEYHAPTTWDGAYLDTTTPDNDPKTQTKEPTVPGAK